MKKLLCFLLLFSSLSVLPATAQTRNPAQRELERLGELNFTDEQMTDLFSLFLSKAPQLLNERGDAQRTIAEISPQALRILRPRQRQILGELNLQPRLERFGTLSRDERKRFLFDSAKTLVHPSKREWLNRIEDFADHANPR